jgi:hypothetical protein
MTEEEWLACTDPRPMLKVLRGTGKVSERKLLLFACACMEQAWDVLPQSWRYATLVGQRVADEVATDNELTYFSDWHSDYITEAETNLARGANESILLRDIFSNPYRPAPSLPASVLAWNEGTVVRIAEGIYEERAFDRLPILYDALLDAGCDDEALLSHCRAPGPHVRGCWAIDLLLRRA